MHFRSLMRTTVALLGALVFLGVVLAVVVTLRSTGGQIDGGLSRVGWLMPTVGGVMVGVLGWVMLAHRSIDDEAPRVMVQCVSCGAKVMSGWRLCPYCGRRTEDGEIADE